MCVCIVIKRPHDVRVVRDHIITIKVYVKSDSGKLMSICMVRKRPHYSPLRLDNTGAWVVWVNS